MPLTELLGVVLVGYGLWFASEGVKRHFGTQKDWWRPIKGKKRFAYPAASVLLGICFVAAGLSAALSNVWTSARILLYVAAGLFVLVLAIGVGQPRFLHPRWYGALQDRYGMKGLMRLKEAAVHMDDEEWSEIAASDDFFDDWVQRTAPRKDSKQGRGYTSKPKGKS